MKKICFIILNYNDADTTIKLVDELKDWTVNDLHIIVVDNQSIDGSFERLNERYCLVENIDILLSEKNGGYSYGNNFGSKYAIERYSPQYIAIANPDIQIDQTTFEKLLTTFDIDHSVAMVAPIMKSTKGDYKIYSQTIPTYMDDLVACYHSSKSKTIIGKEFQYLNDEKNMVLTEMLPGSFFVLRTVCFEEIGLFDENVFLFCEERILGNKLRDKGYKAVLRSDLFFVHAHSVSIKKSYDIIGTWKILMDSRYYYQKVYNHINFFQKRILKISMKIFLIKLHCILLVYGKVKRWRKKGICRS